MDYTECFLISGKGLNNLGALTAEDWPVGQLMTGSPSQQRGKVVTSKYLGTYAKAKSHHRWKFATCTLFSDTQEKTKAIPLGNVLVCVVTDTVINVVNNKGQRKQYARNVIDRCCCLLQSFIRLVFLN